LVALLVGDLQLSELVDEHVGDNLLMFIILVKVDVSLILVSVVRLLLTKMLREDERASVSERQTTSSKDKEEKKEEGEEEEEEDRKQTAKRAVNSCITVSNSSLHEHERSIALWVVARRMVKPPNPFRSFSAGAASMCD